MPRMMSDAAGQYIGHGWVVLPMRPRGKVPLLPSAELAEGEPSIAIVTEWFERWPEANLGVATGASSGIVVFDIEAGGGGDRSMAALERENGTLPPTPIALTGGGSRHLYFSHPGGWIPNRTSILPGVNVHGDGACVVLPPSLHPSGRPYRWAPSHSPAYVTPAPVPEWLLPRILPHPPRSEDANKESAPEGAQSAALTTLAKKLMSHGLDAGTVHELVSCWNRQHGRPPLSEAALTRLLELAGGRQPDAS